MARPEISTYDEARAYIAGGRSKVSRPLYSKWVVKLIDPDDANTNIGIYDKNHQRDPDSTYFIVHHQDGTVDLNYHADWLTTSHIELFESYSGVQGLQLNQWGNTYHIPSMGVSAADIRLCNYCQGTKVNDCICPGPGECSEALSFPSYLRITGAPGAHCAHGYYETHHLDVCLDHGMRARHNYDIPCRYCSGTGNVDHGSQTAKEAWPKAVNASGVYLPVTITIKDGQLVK
jgi:hypothetical protein